MLYYFYVKEGGSYYLLQLKVDDLLDFSEIRITDENGETRTYNVDEELKVNEYSIRKAFLEQPAKYAYWSSVLEKLKLYQESYELQLTTRKAEIYDSTRQELIQNGIQRPTKDQIEAFIQIDSEVQRLSQAVVAMNYNVRRIQAFTKAVEQRKDMLVQYGADLRRDVEYNRKISAPQPPEFGQPET